MENYRIDTDPPRRLMRLRLTGQWDVATVERYSSDVDAALERLRAASGQPGEYLLLVDLRSHGIQSQEVTTALQALSDTHARFARKRAMIVSVSALHLMQVKRVSQDPDRARAFFRDEDEALAWLFT